MNPLRTLLGATLLGGVALAAATGCSPKTGPVAPALATLTAAASDPSTPAPQSDTAISDPLASPDLAEPDPLNEVASARQTDEAIQGIANVEGLLEAEPPLATIAPSGSEPDGRMLYVRNGRFFVAEADRSDIRPLDSADSLPSVWAPPDDPGQAFASPDGESIVFFGGRDAELWFIDADGGNARALTGPNIPTGAHEVVVGQSSATLRFQPGHDYTVAVMPEGEPAVSLFVDNNSRHVRGQGRLRVIHVSGAARDKTLTVRTNGEPAPRTIAYGRDTGDVSIPFGTVNLEVLDESGSRVALVSGMTLAEREIKTVFLYGSGSVKASEASYLPSEPTSGASRVRVFNATDTTQTVRLAEGLVLAPDVGAGAISSYTAVNAAAGNDQLADIERTMYGLDSGVAPVAWSPDGSSIAYVAAPDGQLDLYVASVNGAPQRLSNDPDTEMAPAWSPDGERLAWISLDAGFDVHRLYSLRIGDARASQVDLVGVATAAGLLPDAGIVLPERVGWVDENRMFFYPVVSGRSQGIWVADVAANQVAPVYPEAIEQPVWSSEAGSWAAMTQDGTQLVAVTPDGRITVLATGEVNAPMWSPDGQMVSWVEGESSASDGWVIHIVNADGTGDRALTTRLPTLQASPPVPGPRVKRVWMDDGRILAFSRAGRDYGAAERGGGLGGTAGEDIENIWLVPTEDGESRDPQRVTDLRKHFYFKEIAESPDGESFALVAFSYLDRTQKLWAVASDGGKPVEVDSGVRWFTWLR